MLLTWARTDAYKVKSKVKHEGGSKPSFSMSMSMPATLNLEVGFVPSFKHNCGPHQVPKATSDLTHATHAANG